MTALPALIEQRQPPRIAPTYRIVNAGNYTVAGAHSYPEALQMQTYHQNRTLAPHAIQTPHIPRIPERIDR